MQDIMCEKTFLLTSDNIKIKGTNCLYIIQNKRVIEIDYDMLKNCAELDLWQDFSKKTNSVVIAFTYTNVESSLKRAFVFERGDLLSIVSEGKAICNNMVTVFDLFFGRVGVVFESDLIDKNILYFFESLGIDYIIIYANSNKKFLYSIKDINFIKIVIDKDRVLFV